MLAIIRMIVVLSSICGLSGFALSYLKISTAPRIEEQVLTYVQGPAILKVFADIDNSPIAERKTFTLDGAKVTVFPGKKDGKLVAVALEHFGKGFGGDVGVMVGYDVNRDTLTGIGITTMKETPGLGTRVADPAFARRRAIGFLPVPEHSAGIAGAAGRDSPVSLPGSRGSVSESKLRVFSE